MCDPRGKEQRAVHEGAVVVVADEVVRFCGLVTHVGSVDDLDSHRVVGVVEVDDVDVKDEHSRRRDHITWLDHTEVLFIYLVSFNEKCTSTMTAH